MQLSSKHCAYRQSVFQHQKTKNKKTKNNVSFTSFTTTTTTTTTTYPKIVQERFIINAPFGIHQGPGQFFQLHGGHWVGQQFINGFERNLKIFLRHFTRIGFVHHPQRTENLLAVLKQRIGNLLQHGILPGRAVPRLRPRRRIPPGVVDLKGIHEFRPDDVARHVFVHRREQTFTHVGVKLHANLFHGRRKLVPRQTTAVVGVERFKRLAQTQMQPKQPCPNGQ